jgi:pimeloyl-ACP methyl ester carboxylesterase
MGGRTASMAAAKYPELIGKALLEDPAWWDEDNNPRQAMSDEDREKFVEERRANIIADNQRSRAALIAKCREDCPLWSELELGNWAISKQQLSPNVVNVFGGMRTVWRDIAEKIECPTLLITADVDKGAIVNPGLAEKAMKINANIQVANLDAGHNVRREAFKAYMKVVKAFLQDA